MRFSIGVFLMCVVILVASRCAPCDCLQATFVGFPGANPLAPVPPPAGLSISIVFDESIWPWVKDKFKITVIQKGGETTVSGTFTKSGDTIRFDADRAIPFLLVKSGEVNSLKCDDPQKGQFTVTPPTLPAGIPTPMIFQCTKAK